MKQFMIRVLQAAGLTAWSTTAEDKLTGLIANLISKGQAVESFDKLREVLQQEFTQELPTTDGTKNEIVLQSKGESVAARDQHQVQKAFFLKAGQFGTYKEDNAFTERTVERMKEDARRKVEEEERRVAELTREAAEKRASEE